MKKILIISMMIFLSVFSFSEIVDNINLFSEEDEIVLEGKIKEFQRRTGAMIIVAATPYGSDYKSERPEMTIIINFQKNNSGDEKISQSFTMDLQVEDIEPEMKVFIENLDEFYKKKDYVGYVEQFLLGSDEILTKNGVLSNDGGLSLWDEMKNNIWRIILWLTVAFTFINVLTKVRTISKVKKKELVKIHKEKHHSMLDKK
ncbi:MAG: hypothetical protein ACRCSK_08670 [Fusobacteriaceae bacterium]